MTRALRWFHRWTGVALCLLFLVWFASGAVLAFVPFPSLGDRDRIDGGEILRLQAVKLTPSAALKAGGGGDRLSLVTTAGRTVYLVGEGKVPLRAVDAATGASNVTVGPDQAAAAAAAFARRRVGAIRGPLMYDQWVVHQGFDPWRPFYRVSVDDGAGTQLYVSARTGEVVQRTRGGERAWNWVGAVTHWLYFTALRQNFFAWDQTVWWISLLGVSTAVVGTWLGVYRTIKRMRGRRRDWSPFRGWLRWHHGIGLGVAVFVMSWIISGWLSMDHGRLFSRGSVGPTAQSRYEGAPLAAALKNVPVTAFTALGPSRRISFSVVGGRPIAAAEGGEGSDIQPRVVMLDAARPVVAPRAAVALLTSAAARAWPLTDATLHGPEAGDALYRLADGLPARAVRLPLARPSGASLYLDPLTGRVLTLMDDSRKAYAWIYFAVHTFNFPFLIDRPILRRTLEMIPLSAGFVFSLTGLVIAVKRLRITTAV